MQCIEVIDIMQFVWRWGETCSYSTMAREAEFTNSRDLLKSLINKKTEYFGLFEAEEYVWLTE